MHEQELIDCLERCVRHSAFVSYRAERIGWEDYRRLAQQRRWNDYSWMFWPASKLEIDEAPVADLAARLAPALAEFMDAGTGRIGNGLSLLLGGSGSWAYPTVAEFARTLIAAAVRSSAPQVVEMLLGWASGEPFRLQFCALLEGADVDEELRLPEGIRVYRLPKSSADLPASLPSVGMVTEDDLLGGVVMSIDCEMSPALYHPDEDKAHDPWLCAGEYKPAPGLGPNLSLGNFCESVSLASNGCVDWFLEWRDFGALEAFSDTLSGGRYNVRSGRRRTKTKVSQAALEEALNIHRARYGGGKPRENMELAISRWVKSKREGMAEDQLIDIRIALEALYEIGNKNKKGFRIATYGAGHLGEDSERRREIQETLRKAYSAASSAVHADKLEPAEKDPALIASAQNICREGILKRLDETEKPDWNKMILGPAE